MELEPQATPSATPETLEFAEPPERKPLELLRDTERSLRLKTLDTFVPVLPAPVAETLESASTTAETSLDEVAKIDLNEIGDWELQPARIQVGLAFIGFGALMLVFLLVYFSALHPELSSVERLRQGWYQYIWFVCLGVTGLMLLGRESMRFVDRNAIENARDLKN